MDARTLKFSGKRLAKARHRKTWSQHELAKATGFRENAIARWERGDHSPRGEVVVILARALEREIEFFYVETSADEEDEEAAPVGSASASLESALRAIARDEIRSLTKEEVA